MIPYSRQSIADLDIAAVERVLRSDYLTTGPEVPAFELELAEYIGCKEVVMVNSGTAALHLALLANGVQPGEEVAVPALTFVATANAVLHAGAVPHFCDVDPDTLLMRVADTGPNTTAVLPVSLFGQACWSGQKFFRPPVLIEDAAHGLGAIRQDGQRVGATWCATFSLHPVKLITTGEGGAIAFDDPVLAKRARQMRNHGRDENDGQMVRLGWNYRMSDINAALGRSQLWRTQTEGWVEQRRALALEYLAALEQLVKRGDVVLPKINVNRSAWHLFPVLFESEAVRNIARAVLRLSGYHATVHYPVVPLQPYYRYGFGYKPGRWPVAEDAASRLLSLPLWPGMPEDTVERVVGILEGM